MRYVTHIAFLTALLLPHMVLAAEEGTDGGLPQFDSSTYPSQILWLAITFIAMYVLMSRVALPHVAEVLESRRAQRENNLATAEKLQVEVEDVKTAYEEKLAEAHAQARDLMQKAEEKIKDVSARRQAEFGEKAKAQITEAENRIAEAKQEALDSISDIAAETAVNVLGKLSIQNISQADAKKATLNALKEVA